MAIGVEAKYLIVLMDCNAVASLALYQSEGHQGFVVLMCMTHQNSPNCTSASGDVCDAMIARDSRWTQNSTAGVIAQIAHRIGVDFVLVGGGPTAIETTGHLAVGLKVPAIGPVCEIRSSVVKVEYQGGLIENYATSTLQAVGYFLPTSTSPRKLPQANAGAETRTPTQEGIGINAGLVSIGHLYHLSQRSAILVGTNEIEIGVATSTGLISQQTGVEPIQISEDLGLAEVVIAIGAGIGSVQLALLSQEIAKQLEVGFGATRAVTDFGWIDNDRQIGSTGVTISPSLYIALGISGASQHLAGLDAPGRIVAINTDPGAPIFALADLAIVADVTQILEALTALIAQIQGANPTQRSPRP